jgi:toxin secretion/phage lysis holin
MATWDKFVKYLAAAGGCIAGFLGEWNVMLTVLACMMALDYISGLMVAAAGKSPKTENGGISSKIGFQGLMKKGFIIVIVLAATFLDRALGTDKMIFQLAAAGYYIANEGISILENADLLGVPFPKKIRDAFEDMRKSNDENNPPGGATN